MKVNTVIVFKPLFSGDWGKDKYDLAIGGCIIFFIVKRKLNF